MAFKGFLRDLSIYLVLICAPCSYARDAVKIGYIEFPPVFYTNTAGTAEGVLIDLADQVLTSAGYNWTAKSYPTKRMARHLVDGKIDLWLGLSTLPSFKGTTFVGKSKLLQIELQAYTIGEAPPIRQKTDLNNKSIIILRGYSYGGWVNHIKDPSNNIIFHETDSHKAAFKMLSIKRAQYLLDYKLPSNRVLKNMKIPDLQYNSISAFAAHFVVSKKAFKAQKLLNDMERTYQSLKNRGEIHIID